MRHENASSVSPCFIGRTRLTFARLLKCNANTANTETATANEICTICTERRSPTHRGPRRSPVRQSSQIMSVIEAIAYLHLRDIIALAAPEDSAVI